MHGLALDRFLQHLLRNVTMLLASYVYGIKREFHHGNTLMG
ncbi:hypothetical protein SAMN06295970_11511 [Noviherbaspirillum suwonense]|jgi:hypothetical protein|uniref:Uncharacterized protein n=1 Tax=Noviherbaspirillum suwonense TaxID=1224511 RepID=A0ABY1QEV0_9BURK|nr:hypothetical protein SAMN06295970_11511 [Noviherbaspirillum suwonense]